MNVVMYVGSAAACALVRKYEFFFPRLYEKDKKKNSSHGIGESKQDRIKFDVLLTSYEMINMDDESLKAIYWETMIVEVNDRLKNKDSKLFSSLEQFKTRHRTVLNRTALQNNMGELFHDAAKMQTTPEQELGTTPKHDAGSGFTKAVPITGVDDSCGKTFQSSAGIKGNTQVIVSDDIPPEEHELVTQTRELEDSTNHLKRKRGTPPESVAKKPTGLQKGSFSPDHHGNSLTNYQQDWPFIKRSRLWATIEFYSQKPHFVPLKEITEDYREGIAIAHMVTFENIVQKLSDLKSNDPVDLFNSLKTLRELETHGFDVGPIRGRFHKLILLKTKMCQQEATRKEVEKELEKCNHENSLVEEETDQLKERLRVLKSKSEQIATMQKEKEEELKRLQSNDLELVLHLQPNLCK
ncbi:uncharacterized protein LOC143615011 [Bidens hawaiensis]|uniref:uncharacterized protein LOC143615011 n=1 Tax=Bidens hawaiensis TaxID=980011 RepID=UPI00404A6E8B